DQPLGYRSGSKVGRRIREGRLTEAPDLIGPPAAREPADGLLLACAALADGDLEAAVALYEPDAALAWGPDPAPTGRAAIPPGRGDGHAAAAARPGRPRAAHRGAGADHRRARAHRHRPGRRSGHPDRSNGPHCALPGRRHLAHRRRRVAALPRAALSTPGGPG